MEVSGALVGLEDVVVLLSAGYFLSKSSCLIEPRRTKIGVLGLVVVGTTVGTFRSIDSRGFVDADESAANARRGPLERVGLLETTSSDDRGLLIELVVELVDERRLLS